jgi:hypothetical protein
VDPDEGISPEELARRLGFRARAAAEAERFRLATDSERWLTFGFRHPDDPERFAAALGLVPDRRRVSGPALSAAVAHLPAPSIKDRARRLLASRSLGASNDAEGWLASEQTADPLANVVYANDLAADAEAEYAALLQAFLQPPDQPPANVLDSPHWLVAYWPSREAKEKFLTDTGCDVLGDKYLDGHQVARVLQVTL